MLSISIDNEMSTKDITKTGKNLIWIIIFKSSNISLYGVRHRYHRESICLGT